jgi:hypothetical protein
MGNELRACELCDRERYDITGHHLIPRTLHNNKKVQATFPRAVLNITVPLCKPCHKQIHELISEKDLGWEYNTVEKLKAHPEVAKWIAWVRKKTF